MLKSHELQWISVRLGGRSGFHSSNSASLETWQLPKNELDCPGPGRRPVLGRETSTWVEPLGSPPLTVTSWLPAVIVNPSQNQWKQFVLWTFASGADSN